MTVHGNCHINTKNSYHLVIHVKYSHDSIRSSRGEILLLIRDKQTRNRRARESTNRTREHRANSNTGHISTTTGRDLGQDTDLVTQGADVGESTERVSGD
jgi:hypothetical protein